MQVFKNVGLNMVLFLAALQGVPRRAVRGGQHRRRRRAGAQFRRITVPLISPTILLTSIITVVGSLQVFAQIAVLTQGGPGISTTVLVYYLYQQAFQFHHFGYGATLSVLLFVIVAGADVLQWQMRKRWVFHESDLSPRPSCALVRRCCCVLLRCRSSSRPGGWSPRR